MATPFSILAWKIPWTEEPGGPTPCDHKESNMAEHTCTHASLVVQWLRLLPSIEGGAGSIPSKEAKISHASWPKPKHKTEAML